jgi:hypothetical protein
MAISEDDVERVAMAARSVAPAAGGYQEPDFVMNLLATVVDFQTHTTAVENALNHFRANRWNEIRTFADLNELFGRYSDNQTGNTALAQYLWGYSMWTRAHMLRDLVSFFDSIGVRDQATLVRWAAQAEFRRSFQGRVRGLGPAVFQGLVMRQAVDTVKPDVHVRRFAEAAVGRRLNDNDVIAVVTRAARRLRVKAYELDWALWEHGRRKPSGPR